MRYLALWVEGSIGASDRTKLLTWLKNRLYPGDNDIDIATLPRWERISDSVVGRGLLIDIQGKGFDLTVAEARAARDANLSEPNKVKFATIDSFADLGDMGYREIG